MKGDPPVVLGRFNSSRSMDILYTVMQHQDGVMSCSCPAWKFSKKRLGHFECKHTRHVDENGCGEVEPKSFHGSEQRKSLRVKEGVYGTPRKRFALAVSAADVQLSDEAFKRLLKELRPYLQGEGARAVAKHKSETHTVTKDDEVLRVITLD